MQRKFSSELPHMTYEEAAKRLGVTRQTVTRLANNGRLTALKNHYYVAIVDDEKFRSYGVGKPLAANSF